MSFSPPICVYLTRTFLLPFNIKSRNVNKKQDNHLDRTSIAYTIHSTANDPIIALSLADNKSNSILQQTRRKDVSQSMFFSATACKTISSIAKDQFSTNYPIRCVLFASFHCRCRSEPLEYDHYSLRVDSTEPLQLVLVVELVCEFVPVLKEASLNNCLIEKKKD